MPNSKFLILFATLFFATTIVNGQQSQFLRFWTGSDCKGTVIVNVTANLTFNISAPTRNISYRTNGLWAIEVWNGTAPPCINRTIAAGNGDKCNSLSVPSNQTTLQVTRFGDALQNETAITFFTEPDFQGESQTVAPPGNNFTSPMLVRSYFFTGVNNWAHKVNTSANGTCLGCLTAVRENGYGFTFMKSANLQIDSVVYNCSTPPASGGAGAINSNYSLLVLFGSVIAVLHYPKLTQLN